MPRPLSKAVAVFKVTSKTLNSKPMFECPNTAVPEYCWLSRLVSRMAQDKGPSVFPMALQTILGDVLRLSPSTVGSPDWFPEWLGLKAHRFSQSLFKPYLETRLPKPSRSHSLASFAAIVHSQETPAVRTKI